MTMAQADGGDLAFSIVVPTYNRPTSMARCLEALSHQAFAQAEFEVIVVDDGSDKPLDGLLAAFSSRLNITSLRQQNTGPAGARNAGLRVARGQFIAFTDDDCSPAPHWLAQLKSRFARDPKCAVAGRASNGLTENPYSVASQMLVDYLLNYYNNDDKTSHFGTSNNLTFPRQALLDMGGFDETFTMSAAEDRELVDRWINHGNRLVYDPEVEVLHFHDMNLRGFTRQHMNYGRGARRYHLIRAQNRRGSVRLEPFSFYAGLLKYPFQQTTGFFWRPQLALLIVWSQCANAFGYFREKWAG